jgi:CMP-2-keto-3-deoxyoctulosonic acid synthetase
LEQLRAVQAGIKIKTFEARHQSLGVDTEEDLKHAKIFFRKTRLSIQRTQGLLQA